MRVTPINPLLTISTSIKQPLPPFGSPGVVRFVWIRLEKAMTEACNRLHNLIIIYCGLLFSPPNANAGFMLCATMPKQFERPFNGNSFKKYKEKNTKKKKTKLADSFGTMSDLTCIEVYSLWTVLCMHLAVRFSTMIDPNISEDIKIAQDVPRLSELRRDLEAPGFEGFPRAQMPAIQSVTSCACTLLDRRDGRK